MIDSVTTLVKTKAGDIPAGSLVQVFKSSRWHAGDTWLLQCIGHTANWTVFRLESGARWRVPNGYPLMVVTNIQNWDSLSEDERVDIELDLMTRGA